MIPHFSTLFSLATTAKPWPERERRTEFHQVDYDEPHRERTQKILAAHPEITELFGPEPKTKFIIAATVLLQLLIAVWVKDQSWAVFLITAYVIGATANQSLFLAIHEGSHWLFSKSKFRNKCYSIMANIAIGIPYASTFAPYHLEHHRYQGHHGVDTDIATEFEAKFFWSIFTYLSNPLRYEGIIYVYTDFILCITSISCTPRNITKCLQNDLLLC